MSGKFFFALLIWVYGSGYGSGVTPAGTESAESLYESINFGDEAAPDFELFEKGIDGYNQLRNRNQLSEKEIITLIDFRKSANEKRLWVIDLATQKLLYHTYVAHGRNSGEVFATQFSNIPNSYQSSLGFYVTKQTYIGKHGTSLQLVGVEHGINDNAATRAIVMHGADYVSESFIKHHGRLGRSYGCPAIPMEVHKEMINELEGGTCLFIYYPDPSYLASSRL